MYHFEPKWTFWCTLCRREQSARSHVTSCTYSLISRLRTCNNGLVFSVSLHEAFTQFIKSFISWNKQSVMTRLSQLVHHTWSKRWILRKTKKNTKQTNSVLYGNISHWIQQFMMLVWYHFPKWDFTYSKSGEIFVVFQIVLDGVAHRADDSINDVHHTVFGHLVSVDDPGTVHRHNLDREEMLLSSSTISIG